MIFKTGGRRHGTACNKEDRVDLYVKEVSKCMIL